jgi:hypothetical protein
MSVPKQLIVSYDNGSQEAIDFDKLDSQFQHELAKLGLCPAPNEISNAKHYMVMQWKDGWQEVISSNKDSMDLLRCFIIRRIEDRGRISFDVGDEYPILYILRRLAMDLNRLLVVSGDSVKSYDLSENVERHEGTFNAGGKLEYVKWDRTDSKYPNSMSDADENMDATMAALAEALETREIGAQELLEMDPPLKIETYKAIAEEMGLKGYQKQADVYGFIELLVTKIGKS